jgi:hypothetical protein
MSEELRGGDEFGLDSAVNNTLAYSFAGAAHCIVYKGIFFNLPLNLIN